MIPTAPLHDAYMAGEDSLHATEFELVFLAYLHGALEIAQTNALLSQGRLVCDGTAAKPGRAIESDRQTRRLGPMLHFGGVNKKKKTENAAVVGKPLVVDDEHFTDAIRSLVNSPPAPLDTIRRKNLETDPRYRPGFDFIPKIRIAMEKRKH
jgi:hypothetical protein